MDENWPGQRGTAESMGEWVWARPKCKHKHIMGRQVQRAQSKAVALEMQQITGIAGCTVVKTGWEEQVVQSGRWCSGSWFPQPEQLQLQPEPRPKPDIRVRTLGATNNCDRLHRVAGSAFYTLTKGITIYIDRI